MRNNTNDLVTKKIESVTTLSGGIVFGKEEAWEKLQLRLESKPVKKIRLFQWMAAAAVLLVFVFLLGNYYFPGKDAVVKTSKQKVSGGLNNFTTAPKSDIPIAGPSKTSLRQEGAIKTERHILFSTKVVKNIEQPAETDLPVAKRPLIENEFHETTIESFSAATPEAKPMRVVHINDVENNRLQHQAPSIAANSPLLDFGKLKVVHINDVEKQEREVKIILRENRMTLGHYPFIRPAFDNSDIGADHEPNENLDPRKPFKNIFNPQN